MLVVCTEGHEPVCWDPVDTDECWMCGRSILAPPSNARYSEARGDKLHLDGSAIAAAAVQLRSRSRRKRKAPRPVP
ncbi:MAG TPA: hypothetical protein VE889_05085 [Actinomycetota bacterium]|nr:hypothetical protein [Actinomycetota bacterium]